MTKTRELTKEEAEIKKEMDSSFVSYSELGTILEQKYDVLRKKQDELPKEFMIKEGEDFEDHMILASQCKHASIELLKDSIAIYESMKVDCDYYAARLKLYVAESFLSECGFDKATDSLRDSFVKANDEIRQLLKVKADLESIKEAAERLVKAFEADEVSIRKLLDKINKLTGI